MKLSENRFFLRKIRQKASRQLKDLFWLLYRYKLGRCPLKSCQLLFPTYFFDVRPLDLKMGASMKLILLDWKYKDEEQHLVLNL